MITIDKYELKGIDMGITVPCDIPKGAKILTVQIQNSVPCIWAIVDTSQEIEERYFTIKGTGWEIEDLEKVKYIGSYQELMNIWHVFEKLY